MSQHACTVGKEKNLLTGKSRCLSYIATETTAKRYEPMGSPHLVRLWFYLYRLAPVHSERGRNHLEPRLIFSNQCITNTGALWSNQASAEPDFFPRGSRVRPFKMFVNAQWFSAKQTGRRSDVSGNWAFIYEAIKGRQIITLLPLAGRDTPRADYW